MIMCVQPMTVKVCRSWSKETKSKVEYYVTVPCGHCPQCRSLRRLQWTFRLEQESLVHRFSYFITLTYSDKFLPNDKQLYKPDFQEFVKRLRSYMCRKFAKGHWKDFQSPKYFGCGEYGDTFGRCHFHCILYSNYKLSDDDIRAIWTYGYITLAPFTAARAAYVVKYSQKQLFCDYPPGTVPPCSLCSQGLGLSWLTPAVRRLYKMTKQTCCFTLNNTKVPLPKYLFYKIYTEQERRQIRFEREQEFLKKEKQMISDFGINFYSAGRVSKVKSVWNNSFENIVNKVYPNFHFYESDN